MNEPLEQLISIINELQGNKIITLTNFEKQQSWQYDFSETGAIGYSLGHKAMFMSQLLGAMCVGGSIVVRQFTDIRNNNIPVKKLYGISLCNNKWYPISVKEMEIAHTTDAKTGNKIPKEKNIVFAELHVERKQYAKK